jgi:predicted ABC-type sugar transport system permease subunit
MDAILTDILFSLARAGVATFLARELYAVTVPVMLLFSLTVYLIITRDPLRTSLPPYIGLKGLWRVLHGHKRILGRREIARLSVLGRDAFWVSEGVLNELIYSKQMVQVFQGKGIFMEYTDKEKMAVENVVPGQSVLN